MYNGGDGIDKDYNKAFELFHRAANSRNSNALYNLALMYQTGKGVIVTIMVLELMLTNKKKAFEFHQQSANLGHRISQYNLGIMYENGIVVDKDYDKAFELYNMTANSGSSSAQHNLAVMYEFGKGIQRDINQVIY
ncbi:Sel1 repeat family protein [Rhizophagus clarus]|uniref:Sel1 repeat family protein n=2 Tax=Rhizophagus clarus TaxID=94130 RepID=A0A8H3R1Z0_9GLOM|nr:Sel1 repeat family protein [Rhizophagus clarus]